jgi:prepilin-type N-terminal cleavage/methylation domain-containing protein/prepilin-type processing-associated H-X9-DG protein
MRKNSGFTLIELLVVMVIISILLAVFFPTYTSVKEQGYLTTCQANVRQVGLALQSYINDNDDLLPPVSDTAADSWVPTIKTYAKEVKILKCPKDVGTPQNASWSGNPARITYGLNGDLARRRSATDPEVLEGGVPISAIVNPSRCITNAELKSGEGGYNKDYFIPSEWPGGDWSNNEPKSIATRQHGEVSVYLFADGHTAAHKFSVTWKQASSTSRGINWYDKETSD